MSDVSEISSEAAALVRKWAGNRSADDSVKALIRRAAHRLGFSFSRTKALWYGEVRRLDAFEIDRLRRTQEAADAADEITQLRRRVEALERHQAVMDAADALARISGGSDVAD